MGMSNDFKLAIDCGSNMIRIGSLIFVKEIINIYSIIDIETGGKFNFEKITEIAIFKIDTKGNVTNFIN